MEHLEIRFQEAMEYALGRLSRELGPQLTYHNLAHTRDEVLPVAERLAAEVGVAPQDRVLVQTAALYHDIGFLESYAEHEASGIRIAQAVLPGFGYSPEQIEVIARMILATRLPQRPENMLDRVLADADLDILGSEAFLRRGNDLRLELEAIGVHETAEDWYRRQMEFLRAHRYWTRPAASRRDSGKERNLQLLAVLLDQTREERASSLQRL